MLSIVHMPRATRKLLPEAFFLSGYYSIVVLKRPFPRFASSLGARNEEPSLFDSSVTDQVMAVKAAIASISKYTPWDNRCFIQALTAKAMLVRRGIHGTLYLGLCKMEHNAMTAHAWTKCGEIYVTGGQGDDHNAIVAFFSY